MEELKRFVNNWATQLYQVSESTLNALERAKRREKRLEKKGWRWIKVNGKTYVYVECDKDGVPTEESKRKIAALNKL